ncbi:Scaffold-type E3 ligase [Xylographa opegraphella]|nr:Scaffold-type E3 ligase [Xylographa opegraphella]
MVEYGLLGNDGRGQSIKLVPVDNDGEDSHQVLSTRDHSASLKFYWEGLIKDYKEMYLSDEDRERINNNELRPLLQSWVRNAQDPVHWMTFENLPMLFRFALRRPLMPAHALIKRLVEMGVIGKSAEDVVEEQDCYVVKERNCHVSTKYKQRISKGNALDGPLVTWLYDQPPVEPPIAIKAERKVSFALDSLSEEERELIEDTANAIALCRSGGYTLEQTVDILYENFIGYDYDYLKYLPDIESGGTSPRSLAERIYDDTQEEAPFILDSDDDEQVDEDEDEDDKVIREAAKSICLCRSGACTPAQTVDLLYDQFIGYGHDYSRYLPAITSGMMSPNSLAKRIYKDTEMEASHGVDGAYEDKVKNNELKTDGISQNEVIPRHESKFPKVTIKFKFDIKGRFQHIYQQVQIGGMLPKEALSMFRSAAEKPDISDNELAQLMVEHNIPSDLFFSCEDNRPDMRISNTSEDHCEAKSQINIPVGPLTPQDSRRTSKLLIPHLNSTSVVRFAEPDTPPEDLCPRVDSEQGMTLPSDTSGDEKTEMLIQALQKLVDPKAYDCLCIDDSSEEPELASPFLEEIHDIAVGHKEHEECSAIANSMTVATIPEAGPEAEIINPEICNTNDQVFGLSDLAGGTSFLSRASFAMRPVKTAVEVMMPHLESGSSHRARIRHETDFGSKWDDSNPDFRKHDRSDWEGYAQGGAGAPPDDYAFICEQSSSPECGETTALWGLAMPTRKARELGANIGLSTDYVHENFRSSTPNRDAARKRSKLSERRSIPYLKRKSESLRSNHRMHKSRKGNEVTMFAEDDDDQISFVEKRLRAPTPMGQVGSRSPCSICESYTCNCRQLETGRPKMRLVSALPSIEPSDSSTRADVCSVAESAEFERECRALARYTIPVMETQQTCQPSAHDKRRIGCSAMVRKDSPFSLKPGDWTEACTFGTQGTPGLVKDFVNWRSEWNQTDDDRNDSLSQKVEMSPEEPASTIIDEGTIVRHPEAPNLSLLASTSSIGPQSEATSLAPVGIWPVPKSNKSIRYWAGKDNSSEMGAEARSEAQSTSRSIRNGSISTTFLPLTIGSPIEEIEESGLDTHLSSDITWKHTARPAVVARRCSVVTTMRSLTIDGEEPSLPASSHSQPRPSGYIEVNSAHFTVEHIEDVSPVNLLSGICSSSVPNPRVGTSGTAVAAKDRVNSEELPNLTASSSEPMNTSSSSVVSMVEHFGVSSAGDASRSTGRPLFQDPQEIDLPIPVCPSSPRPAAARLPQKAPVLSEGNDSSDSRNALLKSIYISDSLPGAKNLEQTRHECLPFTVSALLKRSRAESNSSLIRPSTRLRISSPVRESSIHQDNSDVRNIQENHHTPDSFSSLSSSAPVSHPHNIAKARRSTSSKSRLLAKMDRYLARVKRLPDAKVQQIKPWTQDTVEAAAWKFRASPRVFLWSKRQDREQRKRLNANQMSYTRYFQNPSASTGKSGTTSSLNKLFDKYRDDPESPDTIGAAGTMKYLMDLTLSLDEPVVLAILTELSAPTMGELTREGFLAGWRALGADSLPKQTAVLPHLRGQLSANPDYFRRVYKHTFLLARTPGQKGVALDTAIEFWRLLFGSSGIQWRGRDGTDWLGLWCGFVEERWKKSVSKDMWDQTGVFALKSLEDGTMAWWSEDGAWPGVLDEFVVFVRERRGDGGDGMDVE